jgi:hypothetical protein
MRIDFPEAVLAFLSFQMEIVSKGEPVGPRQIKAIFTTTKKKSQPYFLYLRK